MSGASLQRRVANQPERNAEMETEFTEFTKLEKALGKAMGPML
jgi:hypothetical protein